MTLLPDWKDIIKKAWSIRLMLIAGLLTGAEMILPIFSDAIPSKLFAILTFVLVAAALVARLMAQNEIESDTQ